MHLSFIGRQAVRDLLDVLLRAAQSAEPEEEKPRTIDDLDPFLVDRVTGILEVVLTDALAQFRLTQK